jgi:hypothetical protein
MQFHGHMSPSARPLGRLHCMLLQTEERGRQPDPGNDERRHGQAQMERLRTLHFRIVSQDFAQPGSRGVAVVPARFPPVAMSSIGRCRGRSWCSAGERATDGGRASTSMEVAGCQRALPLGVIFAGSASSTGCRKVVHLRARAIDGSTRGDKRRVLPTFRRTGRPGLSKPESARPTSAPWRRSFIIDVSPVAAGPPPATKPRIQEI